MFTKLCKTNIKRQHKKKKELLNIHVFVLYNLYSYVKEIFCKYNLYYVNLI